MGSGKSTIAVFLAQKLQIPFKDLDQIIENETQMTIKTIFESKGEIYFRKIENQTKYFTTSTQKYENLKNIQIELVIKRNNLILVFTN